MIACPICKEMFTPSTEAAHKEVCSKCSEANKKSPLTRLAPRLGQRHALPFDRGVARTVSYGDKLEKSISPNETSKPENSKKSISPEDEQEPKK